MLTDLLDGSEASPRSSLQRRCTTSLLDLYRDPVARWRQGPVFPLMDEQASVPLQSRGGCHTVRVLDRRLLVVRY
jgi:hypothetical protein